VVGGRWRDCLIETIKIVRGAARNAPAPPSSHAQKINPRKRTVGEMPSPRPISIGDSRFSATTLITITPTMTSTARVTPDSARARTTAGATANGRPIQGMKLRKKAKMPHISGKSTPNKNSKMAKPTPVTRLTMARNPSWRTTFRPKTVSRSTCRLTLPALACSLFIMAGPSASKNSKIIRMRNMLEEDRVEDLCTQAHPGQHNDRCGEDEHNPQETRLAQPGGYGIIDAA
jgi:hypothetical protein